MRNACKYLLLVAALLMLLTPTFAHHGTGISYDLTVQPVTAKGTITEFKWANPHIGIFVDIKNAEGRVENWSIEGNSPYNWSRMGWSRRTLNIGNEVTIVFYRSKAPNTRAGVVAKVILPDGKEVLRFQRDTPTTSEGIR